MSGIQGRVSVNFPPQALSGPADVLVSELDDTGLIRPVGEARTAFKVEAYDPEGNAIRHFSQPVTITVHYDPDLYRGKESTLSLVYFNEDKGRWESVPGEVDPNQHILIGYSDHLSIYNAKPGDPQGDLLPNMQAFQVAPLTGAATYSIPITVPEGPGGLKPNMALTYNSQAVDSGTFVSQAPWVGMGWNLDTGFITRNLNGTPDELTDDTFSISLNGVNSLLLKQTDDYYHTIDESYLRVKFHDSDNPKWWEAWDKTGNHYEFKATDLYNNKSVAKYPSCSAGDVIYQWGLTKLTNIYQQSLYFTYQFDYAQFQMCSHTVGIDRAMYPYTIVYPNKHYRVGFVTSGGRTDRDTFSEGTFYFVEYQRLRQILIQHDSDNDGLFDGSTTTIRQYTLNYSDDQGFESSTGIYPNLTHDAGGKTLTLVQVQEQDFNPFDSNMNVTLKPVKLTYGDGMHLTRGENGYGGQVDFAYSPWSPDEGAWNDAYQVQGYYMRPGGTLYTWDWPDATYWYNRTFPKNYKLLAPGKNYEFRFLAKKQRGQRQADLWPDGRRQPGAHLRRRPGC